MHQIDELYQKFLNRQCSPDEARQLCAYLKNPANATDMERLIARELNDPNNGTALPQDEAAMEQIKNRLQQRILSQPATSRHTKMALIIRLAAAAAIIMLATTGYYFLTRPDSSPQTAAKLAADVPPGTNKAILKLADGTAINLHPGREGIIVENNTIMYSDGTGIVPHEASTPESSGLMSVSTPSGGTYQVILPDGTRVQLNAASTLTYPGRFRDDRREVKLIGEAYFSVSQAGNPPFATRSSQTANSRRQPIPFIVTSAGQQILVLGTEFNVTAYPDERAVKTTLVNGSVRITALPDNTTGQPSITNRQSLILKPGEQSILSAGEIQTSAVDLNHEIAWTKGLFRFHETSLREVMQQFSRWYGVEVQFKDDIQTKKIYGKLFRHYSLLQATGILEDLEQGNLRFELQHREGQPPLLTVSQTSQKRRK